MDEILVSARRRAEESGWRCWGYHDEIHPGEIVLFVEGPAAPPGGESAAVFGDEIQQLQALARRFEPVRSLVDYPLGEGEDG